MAAFAVGMRETLSIRDALILSLVIDESRCPKSSIRRNLKGLTITEIRVTGPAAGYTRKWARRR